MTLLEAAARCRDACDKIVVPGVPYVYDPLQYAWDPHRAFVERYGDAGRGGRVLLVGMNPGPHGMAQTGVPFGDVTMVRDWMGITGRVERPPRLHPKRPVTGFATTRREPSGARLYGWAKDRYGTAQRFFDAFFVLNYCPLLFFDADGKNLTPPQLPVASRVAIERACDAHLADAIRATRPRLVVGVGGFAEARARLVVEEAGLRVDVGRILHPSPASPEANKGWAKAAEAQLVALGAITSTPRA